VHRPVRVLIDSALRVPPSARLFEGEPGRTWVLCARTAAARRAHRLARRGAVVIPVPARGRHLDLRRALSALAERGLSELLVEGGGGLSAALLREDLVDEVHWFAAPRLIGGDGVPALGPLAIAELARAVELADVAVRRLGPDVHVWGRIRARSRGRR
jgi:diaminohydroxyphosphoribosylaminopyrimidine deaminase/5-amino-6-(5-phosphoribosylamino)uracil reductase